MFYNSARPITSPPGPEKEKATAGVSIHGNIKGSMEEMSRQLNRFDQLEQDTHQIKLDLAVLTERAETFATKSDLQVLFERTEKFATRNDLQVLTERAETFATKSDLQVLTEQAKNFATKSDLNLLRVEVYKAITVQTKWLTACMFTVAVLSLTAAKLLFI